MKQIPMCWKCREAITETFETGMVQLIGCKIESKVKSYADAQEHCPLLCTCPGVACQLHGLPPGSSSGGW